MVPRRRLDPEIFNLPVAKMRAGYYSDKYFVRARSVGVIYRTAALVRHSILATVEVRMDGDLRDVRLSPEPPALWPDELSNLVLSLLIPSRLPSSLSRRERA